MMSILIAVTEQCISAGKACGIHDCPIALALQIHFKPGLEIVVLGHCYTVSDGISRTFRALPAAGSEFIAAFDNEVDVRPFEFTLDTDGIEHFLR